MQAVLSDNVLSAFLDVEVGVPQGSVLGPTLFLLFLNDINNLKLHGRLNLYCDDSALFYDSTSDTVNCILMNDDLLVLNGYLNYKKLRPNETKTKIVHFRSYAKALNNDIPVVFNGKVIEVVNQLDYLGLRLDSHLSWRFHCERICKKIRPADAVGVLYKLKSVLPRMALMQIYFSFVHSHLSHMSLIWGHAPACYLKPIQVLQNRCLKSVYDLPMLTHTVDIYSQHVAGVLPVKGIHILSTLKFVRQVLNNELHHTITFRYKPSTRNLRNNTFLLKMFARNCFGGKQILIYGPRCFNRLPDDVRALSSTSKFIRAVKHELSSADSLDALLRFEII